MEQMEIKDRKKECTWEEAEEIVLTKTLKAIEQQLLPFIFEDSKIDFYKSNSYSKKSFTHKELLAVVPLFQKRRDIIIALSKETPKTDEFYKTRQWQLLRYSVLVENGGRCQCCGIDGKSSVLHVDHIKPRSKYPDLELEKDNLQVLCEDCNMGKSNIDETDWRAA